MAIPQLVHSGRVARERGDPRFQRKWVQNPRNQPRQDNGELQFAQLLEQRGERAVYEPWSYPLRSGFSMVPDFWLPETNDHPQFHFEITWLDWALTRLDQELEELTGRSGDAHRRRCYLKRQRWQFAQRLARKHRKAAETQELHQIEVVLIPYVLWKPITDQPDLLDEFIPQLTLPTPSRVLTLV